VLHRAHSYDAPSVPLVGPKNATQPDQLALGADGALCGTTESGGTTGGGVIFKLTLPG